MSRRIDRVDVRAKLELRRDPYWQRLSEGRYVGFRRMTRGAPGTWLARFYSGEGYAYETLGDFATLPENERYDAPRRLQRRGFFISTLAARLSPAASRPHARPT
jgi:hypothetical protein